MRGRADTTAAQNTLPAVQQPGAGGAQSEQDIDALARRLVEPLSRRLKAEMLIDRERRGVRSDAR